MSQVCRLGVVDAQVVPIELGTGLPALSKSHARRMKRKAKEQLAGDTLSDLSHALASLEADTNSAANAQEAGNTKLETKKPRQTAGLIGEGRSRPLSKSQRKRMLYVPSFGLIEVILKQYC